jgi:hypothetical protein
LNGGITYYWSVKARSPDAYGNWSAIWNFGAVSIARIITQPQSRAVPEGGGASFGVAAVGAPELLFQWQVNGVDIPGATGATYSIPVVSLLDNGLQFRVRVTNGFGSDLSAPATLTVTAANLVTWTGTAGNGNWFTPANWNPATVPTASDVVQLNSVTLSIPANAEFGVLNFNGGVLYGSLTNAGTLNWTSGTLGGKLTVAAGGVLNITGSADKNLDANQSATLANSGTVNWTGGNLVSQMVCGFGGFPVAMNNLAGGTFNIQTDASISTAGCSRWNISNAGLLTKTTTNGTTQLSVGGDFTNTGTIDVQTGTLKFNTGRMTSSGSLNVGTGTSVVFASSAIFSPGATLNVAAGASVTYGGSIEFSSGVVGTGTGNNRIVGNVGFSGTVNLPNFELASGTLGGTFTNAGTLNWTGGALAGRLTVAAGGVLNITGSVDKSFDANQGAVLSNGGTVNWMGGNLVSQMVCGFGAFPVAMNNLAGGTFNIQTDGSISTANCSYWNISNVGLLRKTTTSGTTALSFGGTLANTGIIDIQTGTLSFNGGSFNQTSGETRLNGGTLSGSAFSFAGGRLSGSGTINAAVVNGAIVSPGSSPDTITINGSYTQTAAGILQIELGGLTPGTAFDRLVVNGPASLAGMLNVTLIDGFMPSSNDAFSVLTYTSRTGSFAASTLPALQNGLALTTQYAGSELTLQTGPKKARGQITSQ